MLRLRLVSAALALLACCQSPQPVITPPRPGASSVGTIEPPAFEAAWIADWMDLSAKLVKMTGASPPVASRVYGYSAVALNEGLASVDKRIPSLQGKLNGLASLPKTPPNQALDGRWVAQAALETFVPTLFHVSLSEEQNAEIAALKARLSQQLPADPATRSASEAYGRQLGQALIAWCQQDQFKQLRTQTYTLPAGHPDYWVPTVTGAKPLEPNWGKLRTFAIADGSACHTAPAVGFATAADSRFYAQAKEVADKVASLSDEETTIARWWADNPGQTATPPGHWIAIASQQLRARRLDTPKATRLFSLLGVAMADAFVSTWASKYQVNLLRPMTYIRQYLSQPDWIPLLATPMFPEYPSGHSVSSAAAAEALTAVLGDKQAFSDSTHIDRGMAARSFPDFRAAALEAGISRLYGGIHFRDAIDNGIVQGRCVGKQVISRIGS